MKRWPAVLAALLFFLTPAAPAAEDLNAAARELARKTAAFGNRGEPISITWRNVSSLGSAELGQARAAFESAYQEAGGRLAQTAPATARVTLSENPSEYLLVEEAQAGEERRVFIAAWKRTGPPKLISTGITLDRKLIWEQDEPILDVAFPTPATMLVLSPSGIARLEKSDALWRPRQSQPLAPAHPWPRDLRGHLRVNGSSFEAFLPGSACSGTVAPTFAFTCRAADDPWVLESGSRAILLANFAAARNHFDGRVVTQTGARKTVAPFYSAAYAEEQGRPLWLLAMADGRTQIFTGALDPVGEIANWGSDIAGAGAHCGGGTQILASKPGDATEPDTLQAFAIVDRAPAPLTPPLSFAGPITALWPSDATAVIAVIKDLVTGKYAAYLVTVVCGG